MKTALNGNWILYIPHLDMEIPGTVPGSVYNDLLNEQVIPNPFYRMNEYEVREWMRHDYVYKRTFIKQKSDHDIYLVCEGIDTLSEIYINQHHIGSTNNMHRCYRFLVNSFLNDGENTIEIRLLSPITFIEKKEEACPYNFYQAGDAMRGFIHLRKGHSMFGWDWGPQLPDAGLWRDIYLHESSNGYIDYIQLKQVHKTNQVTLNYKIHIKDTDQPKAHVKIMNPDGQVIHQSNQLENEFIINKPKLWWPIGLGNQDLYQIEVELIGNHSNDQKIEKFGLKTSQIKIENDQYGSSFTYVHNGVEMFLKGANYIIEDNIIGRTSIEKTRLLLEHAVQANHNAIRIWGGGLYPSNDFYAMCDELGLIVWQDFMFACAFYNLEDNQWLETVEQEIKDNVKRLSNHPSLSILCGNNENETAIVDWNVPSLEVSKKMYLELYENLIPKWLGELDNKIPYWPSSPSSGGGFDRPNFDGKGDMHYWGVWHGNEPIEYYRKVFPRFMSEFGIQSFPDIDTVKTFAEPQDFHIYSRVMKSHQKNKTANKKIIAYMRKMFKYPKKFEDILYVSQLIQAEGVRYGVEHFRRNYGRCMGSIYWQLNDCWPVASWSSIDYEGRWKALHYHSKKFYQPILLSIEENKRKMTVSIVITNDLLGGFEGHIVWEVIQIDGKLIESGKKQVSINPQEASLIYKKELNQYRNLKNQVVFYAKLVDKSNQLITDNMVTFVQDKDLTLVKDYTNIEVHQNNDQVEITLVSPTLKRFVQLKYKDMIFSDNFFHLLPNKAKVVTMISSDEKISDIYNDIIVKSLIDTY
jgi:beta-mannosidase